MNDTGDTLTLILVSSLVYLVVFAAVYVWISLALSKLFAKLGIPTWKAWVPFVNTIELLRLGGYEAWNIVWFFVPLLNAYGVVLLIISIHRINERFALGAGMTVLGAIAFPIWATVLGFGQAQPVGSADRRIAGLMSGNREMRAPAGQASTNAFGGSPAIPNNAPAPASFAPFGSPGNPAAAEADPEPYPEPAPLGTLRSAPAQQLQSGPTAPPAPPVQPPSSGFIMPMPTSFPEAAAPAQHSPSSPFAAQASPEMPSAPAIPAAPAPLVPPVFSAAPAAPAAPAFSGAPAAPAADSWARDQHAATSMPPQPAGDDFDDDDDEDERTVVVNRKPIIHWNLVTSTGQRLPLASDNVVLGRKPTAADGGTPLPVPDSTKTLSRVHARLTRTDDLWTITDLNATNGVVVIDASGVETELASGASAPIALSFILGELRLSIEFDAEGRTA
ncbi:DUF5684 domain-containing protein [Salinibacterium sp. PAMC 21357]|uniref:DUF5684 domain-containing protein n=1 Tax=Salinibacterium sp. PAMC 21357 TaxID=1112215 RepID=UPI000288C2BB|nr:DUF5684 domain-containing protein [Salinibacterium sp. PAMC 21357]